MTLCVTTTTDILPRRAPLDASAWNTPHVEDVIPLPTPLMTLPIINCANVVAENWRIAPTELDAAPTRRAFLRPSLSPNIAATRHPTRLPSYKQYQQHVHCDSALVQPAEKMLTNVPSSTGFFTCGNLATKWSLTKMPINTEHQHQIAHKSIEQLTSDYALIKTIPRLSC